MLSYTICFLVENKNITPLRLYMVRGEVLMFLVPTKSPRDVGPGLRGGASEQARFMLTKC